MDAGKEVKCFMEEGRSVGFAILGIVGFIAVVGLVVVLKGGSTGDAVVVTAKLYGGDLTRGQEVDSGFVRYSSNRATHGRLFSDEWSDDFRERNLDSGNGVPYATYNADYKRTGPVKNNPCPFYPYIRITDRLSAYKRDCIPVGVDPETGESLGKVVEKEGMLCCI